MIHETISGKSVENVVEIQRKHTIFLLAHLLRSPEALTEHVRKCVLRT